MTFERLEDGTIRWVAPEVVACPVDPQDALQCESCQ